MPEIGTYPLFSSLVDGDSFLGVSSVDGRTYRGTVAQFQQTLVTNNVATPGDVTNFNNTSRLMSLERSAQLSQDVYGLPRLVGTQTVSGPVSNVIVNMVGHLTAVDDLLINFRNFRFDYSTLATSTIQLDISYDNGVTYPTNNHSHQAWVGAVNGWYGGFGSNSPVLIVPQLSISNPVLLNVSARVFGRGATNDLRTYDWRGSVRYFNSATRTGTLLGSYTTNGDQPLPTHLKLSSTGGQNITSGVIAVYKSRGFF